MMKRKSGPPRRRMFHGQGLIRELESIIIAQEEFSDHKLADRAGVSYGTIYGWRAYNYDPKLSLFVAVLTALGYKLEIVKCENDVPTSGSQILREVNKTTATGENTISAKPESSQAMDGIGKKRIDVR